MKYERLEDLPVWKAAMVKREMQNAAYRQNMVNEYGSFVF